MASIAFKYWRREFQQHGLGPIQDLQVWTDLDNSGDGMPTGWPCKDTTTRLSSYLNRNHCFGRLSDEPVYREARGGYSPTLVLKVQMVPPHAEESVVLSRLDVLKQMFEALVNRLLACNYKTHIGLITFSSEASLTMPISNVVENFWRATSGMDASGDTALFDALALACDQLNESAVKYPDAKKRVICISDGADTNSTSHTAENVAWTMLQGNIAMDSICLGSDNDGKLHAISHTPVLLQVAADFPRQRPCNMRARAFPDPHRPPYSQFYSLFVNFAPSFQGSLPVHVSLHCAHPGNRI